jgi:hypothetical protein
MESGTDLRLLCSFPLYSSFTYLNPTPAAARHLALRYQLLARLPAWLLAALTLSANWILRSADALLGTRLSLYGWGFYFGKPGATLQSVPLEVMINVCAFCGCGHSGGWLDAMKKVRRGFGPPSFACEHCGRRNPYFGKTYLQRILRKSAVDEELLNTSGKSQAMTSAAPGPGTAPQVLRFGDVFCSSPDLAPGTLVALQGCNFTREEVHAAEDEWPVEAAGVRVVVNGKPAPLKLASPGQIVFQLPFSTPRGGSTIAVRTPNGTTSELEIFVSLAAPALA